MVRCQNKDAVARLIAGGRRGVFHRLHTGEKAEAESHTWGAVIKSILVGDHLPVDEREAYSILGY